MSLTQSKRRNLFQRLSLVTLVAVYLLILVGGIVRSTGAGMGCPDWPQCFGQWVPPTEASQLPENYQETYVQQRQDKNARLAEYLTALNFSELAFRIQNDPTVSEEAEFNVRKTWTEYINRLIGAVIGLLIFATFLASLRYRQSDPIIPLIAFLSVLTVGFQGWVGSVVVSTNLLPGMITIHMLLALLLVGMLIFTSVRAQQNSKISKTNLGSTIGLNSVVVLLLVITLLQIVFGTEVRESVNQVARTLGEDNRDEWIGALGGEFKWHRSFSFLVLAGHVTLVMMIYQRFGWSGNLLWWGVVLLMIIGLEIVSGAIMAYFGIPRFAQPVHLLLATIAFGIQFYLLLLLNLSYQRIRSSPKIKEYASY